MAFHIALNMTGAVSAGAYTAGVVDFLVEALDAWYAERAEQQRLHGNDIRSWAIPAHDVKLDVMTGASAGGMTAVLAAVALREKFDHVDQPDPTGAVNRLYQGWVRAIDIMYLLGTEDLPDKQGPVHSLLDSTPIGKIANTFAAAQPGMQQARQWIAEQMTLILTLTNLRGIPYSVDKANDGSFEERFAYHADRIRFTVGNGPVASTDTSFGLNYSDPADPNWTTLRLGAMATGAFPVMLASRIITRKAADYENRLWNVDNEQPQNGECQQDVTIQPAWDPNTVPAAFDNVYADGGVLDNNPFECAREALAEAAGNAGHNPRSGTLANAAVVTIAPFPGDEPFDPDYKAAEQAELGNVLKALVGTLVNQARFQGEDLRLTKDEDVSSRFAIAPSDDSAGKLPALLCGSLGAFGGFVDQRFRERDYQLGRRNCQQFLRVHFAVPEDNVTIADGIAKRPEIGQAFRDEYSFVEDGKRWYPVIPLMKDLRDPIVVPPREDFKTTPARLEQVAEAAIERLKVVLHALANPPGKTHPVWSFLLAAILDLGGAAKIRRAIFDLLTAELGQLEQV